VELAEERGKKIYPVLQLREHPAIVDLRSQVQKSPERIRDVDLTYITSRGPWYLSSWKGRVEHSGGLASNIGIHFFDMLIWIFGAVKRHEVHLNTPTTTAGYIELENARVRWLLSIDGENLPAGAREQGKTTFRSITVDGEELEFSGGFTDLHTQVYRKILADDSFTPHDAEPAVELARQIRCAEPSAPSSSAHPKVRTLSAP
jgi:UDP-N-acetyl-2-amino-2-deoxyglucuronate dehydrogenase